MIYGMIFTLYESMDSSAYYCLIMWWRAVSDYFEGPSDLCFLYDNGLWCHQRCFLISFIHKCMLEDIIGYSSTFFYYTNHHCSTQFKRQGYEENGSTQKEVSSSRCWLYQGEMPRGFFVSCLRKCQVY